MKVRMLQLVENQMARLRVEFQMGRVSIDSRLRTIKQIDQHSAQMTVTRENPSIEANMESLRNNIGLKNDATLTRDMASEAVSRLEQSNREVKSFSSAVGSLPHSGNAIAQYARRALTSLPRVPSASGLVDPTVDIKANPGSININWSLQDVKIIWDDYQAPMIRLDPKPYVNVELEQDAHVEFRVVEQSIPPEAGRTIDEEA